jgi:hypothetical protein
MNDIDFKSFIRSAVGQMQPSADLQNRALAYVRQTTKPKLSRVNRFFNLGRPLLSGVQFIACLLVVFLVAFFLLNRNNMPPVETTTPSQTSEKGSISETNPEPAKEDYTKSFVEQYVSENVNAGPIPRFREDELLFSNKAAFDIEVDAGMLAPLNFRLDMFYRIVNIWPDPLVRQIGDTIYLVYDTDKGTRLFLFFSSGDIKTDGYPIIMENKLSYANFASVRIGEPIENVESVDSVTAIYLRALTEHDQSGSVNRPFDWSPVSLHLLSDGVLKIVYRYHDGAFTVSSMVFNQDFTLDGALGKTCYRILDEDYVIPAVTLHKAEGFLFMADYLFAEGDAKRWKLEFVALNPSQLGDLTEAEKNQLLEGLKKKGMTVLMKNSDELKAEGYLQQYSNVGYTDKDGFGIKAPSCPFVISL